VQQAHPTATVELWAMDEHRVGLKPVLRRVWTRRGQPCRAPGWPRYEWEDVYGWVHPERGETHWQLLPTVNSDTFTLALADFAQQAGAGPTKQLVVVLDGAGWHEGAAVQVPPDLHLVPLPPYSPELQPAERLWPLTNEALANRVFATLDALDTALGDRCVDLAAQRDTVRAHTLFHWWPRFDSPSTVSSRS
jgi:hypothetical protein